MSQYQTSSNSNVIDATSLIKYATVTGRLIPTSPEDYVKLVRLAHDFRKAVLHTTRMIVKGTSSNIILKELRSMLNKAYGDSAYKVAKTLVEGCRHNGGDPRHIRVKKLFIVCEGEASRFGNRNIRFETTSTVKIKYPHDGSWLTFKACFGEKHLPIIRELIELARQKRISYGARIVFRSGRIYLHLSIPIELYLKHYLKGRAKGKLIAGFDLNSDRINVVIIDRYGRIKDIKTEWFPEVTSHGYPRSKARSKRLEALAKLLRYAFHHNVSTVVLENLLVIKKRRYTRSRRANRKITRFTKKELLWHGVVMSMKYGFKILLVDPKGTTNSREHDKAKRRHGLDRHTSSAYIIALRGIERH